MLWGELSRWLTPASTTHKTLLRELDRGSYPSKFAAVVHAVLELYEREIPDDNASVNEWLDIAGSHLEEIIQWIDDGVLEPDECDGER